MTEQNFSNPSNLTGVWHGLYTYPRLLQRVLFGATLIETASWLTGSTHEPITPGKSGPQTLFATLLGTRNGSAVAFRKTYEGSVPGYSVVDYEGTLSSDGTEIEGQWRTSLSWSGKFLMIRSTGKTQLVHHEEFERI